LQKNLEAPLNINIEEVRNPELNAKITADAVVQQIERRVAFQESYEKSFTNFYEIWSTRCKN
jgi:small subunit ribosomal protein S3